mmetsp:Transcript_7468/g.15600  ORF Transcript_7468/g.15600 Transcript_7468/m.15600 type:complete len:82 (+) Transcript_7468:968-1213(+)
MIQDCYVFMMEMLSLYRIYVQIQTYRAIHSMLLTIQRQFPCDNEQKRYALGSSTKEKSSVGWLSSQLSVYQNLKAQMMEMR